MKLPKERIDYSAIVDRKPIKLPGGARIVVWPIVNLEVWDITRPMARTVLSPPTGVTLVPDFPNWSWHEYGMRVGFWRFLASIRAELETLFDQIVFVGSPDDRAVGVETYPGWDDFDDGGDFLKLARLVHASRLMIGVGSSPIVVAGALKVPAIRVHDPGSGSQFPL